MPVQRRHQVFFQIKHRIPFLGLIEDWKRLQGLEIVVELCQNAGAVPGNQRAASIPVVVLDWFPPVHDLGKIFVHNVTLGGLKLLTKFINYFQILKAKRQTI